MVLEDDEENKDDFIPRRRLKRNGLDGDVVDDLEQN